MNILLFPNPTLQVYRLMEAVEIVTRRILDARAIKVDQKVHPDIVKEVIHDKVVRGSWDVIVSCVPAEQSTGDDSAPLSLELLQAIVNLWPTIRCHSFAKGYNILLKSSEFQNMELEKLLNQKEPTRRLIR